LGAAVLDEKQPQQSPRPEETLPRAAKHTRRLQQPLWEGLRRERANSHASWSWGVLAHSGFRLYFAGSVVSNSGTWLQNTAQALLAYHLTHSVLAVGVVVCAQFSTVLLIGPWAGTMVARAPNLRNPIIVTQVLSAAVAGLLTALQFTRMLTMAWLVTGAFALGLVYCFALPAFAAFVPALVAERETRPALAMNSVSYNIGRTVAPGIAVVIVSTIGFGWVFLLNALSFLLLAAAVLKARLFRAAGPSSHSRIRDIFHVARREPSIWLLLAMVAAVTIAADPVLVLGPAIAQRFEVSGDWAGYFLAALGAGTVLASFVPIRPPSRLRHAAYPLALLGAAVIVFALGLNLWLCLAMAFVAGVACLLTGSATQTLLLACAGPNGAALIMAVWAIAWAGSKPLASLTDGFIASFITVPAAGVLLALPALLPALIVIIFFRSPALPVPAGVQEPNPNAMPVS
jgi:MFS family permease